MSRTCGRTYLRAIHEGADTSTKLIALLRRKKCSVHQAIGRGVASGLLRRGPPEDVDGFVGRPAATLHLTEQGKKVLGLCVVSDCGGIRLWRSGGCAKHPEGWATVVEELQAEVDRLRERLASLTKEASP